MGGAAGGDALAARTTPHRAPRVRALETVSHPLRCGQYEHERRRAEAALLAASAADAAGVAGSSLTTGFATVSTTASARARALVAASTSAGVPRPSTASGCRPSATRPTSAGRPLPRGLNRRLNDPIVSAAADTRVATDHECELVRPLTAPQHAEPRPLTPGARGDFVNARAAAARAQGTSKIYRHIRL